MDGTSDNRKSLFGSLKGHLSRKSADEPASRQLLSATPAPIRNSPSPNRGVNVPTRRPDRPGMNAFTTPSNEPPPAYAQALNAQTVPVVASRSAEVSSPSQPSISEAQGDDRYTFLRTFHTVFLIDDSGSMAGRSWRETNLALEQITPICTAYDAEGVDILFLNNREQDMHKNVTSAAAIHEIFSTVRPSGGTPMGQRLNSILKPYLRGFAASPTSTKPLNLIVITDGEPSDDVESVIIAAAKKLDELEADAWQVGIQMFQVGEEAGATEFLQSLDDELTRMGGGCRDIVDTVPFVPGVRGRGIGLTADAILKVLLGAVNKRLDRRRN